MSFFKKLKKNIGVEGGETKEKKAEKEEKTIKEPVAEATFAVAKTTTDNKAKKSIKVEKVATSEKKAEKPSHKKETSDWLDSEGQLAVDVYQTGDEFCVEAPIAGVSPEEIEVFVENEMLVIKGERKESKEDVGKDYFYQECYWGTFSRQISLPEDVDPSKIRATLKKGILKVVIPRAERAKKKRVNILNED